MRRAETLASDRAEVEAKASASRQRRKVRSDTPSTSAASAWLNGRAVVRAYTSSRTFGSNYLK